jgi:hypothetical protein
MSDGTPAAVQADCERRLRALELDASPRGSLALDHLLWALSLLRHFHQNNNNNQPPADDLPITRTEFNLAGSHTGKRKAEEPLVAEGTCDRLFSSQSHT